VSRPAVGITAAVESAGWTVWRDVEVNISQRTYSREVEAGGAMPLLMPAQSPDPERVGALLDLLAGLILTGGADIGADVYGADPAPEAQTANPERDRFELAIASGALERNLPVLGVCRGMQLLNVACGGTLDQQIENADLHLHTPGRFSDHDVRLETGSLAARAFGRERVAVRSHHHQGLAQLGEGLVATGWSEPDGLVEAIEFPGRRFALGVLWHAEEEPGSRLVTALCEAAGEREAVA
jgi:putative glutamine amidotransferase